MRISAYLARAGIASRRKAGELVKTGSVMVNGKLAQLNTEVLESDLVKINGRSVKSQSSRYILLHKPKGYVTTLNDPQGRRKVTNLIKIDQRVIPVGRLDYNTSGLLLLTNDGILAHKLMHPSSGVIKVYEVVTKGGITKEILNKLSNGIKLDDGQTAPASARQIGEHTIILSIHEGRNHQVRRMISACGLILVSLRRINYGNLNLDGLSVGQWRDLSESELGRLKK